MSILLIAYVFTKVFLFIVHCICSALSCRLSAQFCPQLLYMKSYGVFFPFSNKPFDRAVSHTEEAIKTSVITIRRATKFILSYDRSTSILKFTPVP